MRWVKTAVVIAIVAAIIPTMVTVINSLREYETEYITEREEYKIVIRPENITETVNELYNRVKLNENNNVTNFTSGSVTRSSGIPFKITSFYYRTDPSRSFVIRYYDTLSSTTKTLYLDLDDPIGGSNTSFNSVVINLYDEKVIENIIELPPSKELILISLTPLILVSGLLIYQYKELGLKIRKE